MTAIATLTAAALLAVTTAAGAAGEIPDKVLDALRSLVPDADPGQIRPSPVPGLYEVSIGPQLAYLSGDGRFLLSGEVIDIASGDNLTEPVRRQARVAAIDDLGEASMIVFSPDDPRTTITVFTDVTCAYCAKLHSEMAELNGLGVRVRYLAYPRAGISSKTYDEMVSVWCADDPQQAITDAKAGIDVADSTCANPVADHYQMGRMVGVRGTPTIILDDGSIIGGYVPAGELANMARAATEHRMAAR
jgi:thiol:disulfide interchange protein DsbC